VSTAPARCAFAFGPGAIHVLVASRYRIVWDSARCVPQVTRVIHLVRGIPAVMSVQWKLDHARRSCQLRTPGVYGSWLSAMATDRAQSSPPRYFELLR
jgi:hypothetical protein